MFTPTDLLVGVDVHRRTNVVQVMDGAGQVLASGLRVANNRPGTAQLVSQLRQLAAAGPWLRQALSTRGWAHSLAAIC